MREEFKELAPQMNIFISETTNTVASNRIHKNSKDDMTWVYFWFLRELFGP